MIFYWRKGNEYIQNECINSLVTTLKEDSIFIIYLDNYSEVVKVTGGFLLITGLLYKSDLPLTLLPSKSFPLNDNILKSLMIGYGAELIGDLWNENKDDDVRKVLINFIQSFDFLSIFKIIFS